MLSFWENRVFVFWRQTDRQTNRWTGPLHEAALAVASGGLIKDCARNIVLLKLTTDRHEASRGISERTELLKFFLWRLSEQLSLPFRTERQRKSYRVNCTVFLFLWKINQCMSCNNSVFPSVANTTSSTPNDDACYRVKLQQRHSIAYN